MQASFWHQRWQDNQIGFHLTHPNPWLTDHLDHLALPSSGTVFVPLCGKTLDIAYLLSKGYAVTAVELSELAVKQLFVDLKVVPEISQVGAFTCYQAQGVTIYVGDMFALSQAMLGHIDWVYDRAALIALPLEMRQQYVKHLMTLTNHAPQLLITVDYDQQIIDGPPFAIDSAMVERYYAPQYDCTAVAQLAIAGGLKGKVAAEETLWLLRQQS